MRFFSTLIVVYALCGASVVLAQDMGAPQDPAAGGGAMPGDPGMQPAQGQPTPPPGYAQPQQPPPPPAQPMPPEGAGMLAAQEDVRYIDANVDRYIITSTAETHPEGTFYFTNYELIFLQFGYAITDQIQLSLTGLPPMFENQPYFFDLAAKMNLVRGSFRLALIGALDFLFFEDESFVGGRLGGAATICFNEPCWSHLSLGTTAFFNDQVGDYLPFGFSLGVLGRISELVAFIGEGIIGVAVGDLATDTNGFVFNYGIRISGRQFGIDVAFVKPIPFEGDAGGFIMGFPFVSFTYRTEGNVTSGEAPAAGMTGNTTARDLAIRSYVPF